MYCRQSQCITRAATPKVNLGICTTAQSFSLCIPGIIYQLISERTTPFYVVNQQTEF